MSKRKLNKTKTTSRTKATTRKRVGRQTTSVGMRFKKPILVGVALALFAGPASWVLVHAQSDGSLGAGNTAQVSSLEKARREALQQGAHNGSATTDKTNNKATSNGSNNTKDAKNKNAQKSAKANPDKAKASAPAASTKATPSPAAAAPAAKPAPAPTPPAPYTGTHDGIISTVFWVGEPADADNANITNTVSAWDEAWQAHYGGVDDPANRNGYAPAAFAPQQNPFYFALPYNDFDDAGRHKASATNCPNAAALASRRGESWCKNAWIKITHAGKTTYAQWEDVGPMQEDDTAYVFGTARPANTWGAKAGLDVSPAVRDYLGLRDVDTVSWTFIDAGSVPAGPWKQVVTSSGVFWL